MIVKIISRINIFKTHQDQLIWNRFDALHSLVCYNLPPRERSNNFNFAPNLNIEHGIFIYDPSFLWTLKYKTHRFLSNFREAEASISLFTLKKSYKGLIIAIIKKILNIKIIKFINKNSKINKKNNKFYYLSNNSYYLRPKIIVRFRFFACPKKIVSFVY